MLNALIEALTHFINTLYATTGLVGIIAAMAVESCLIPLPSEIVMPLAGIMIQQHKILVGVPLPVSLVLVGLAGAFGCLIGSLAAYYIGYKGGRPLILKYGRYVLISQHDADKADEFFLRWGSATAFFSRLLPVVRTYISLPAGISKMPLLKFSLYTFLGSFPWCVLLAYVGTIVGTNLGVLSPIFHTFDVVIIVVLVVLVSLYVWRHIRNDRLARVAHAIDEANASNSGPLQGAPPTNWAQGAQGQQPQQQWPPNGAPMPMSPAQNRMPGTPGQTIPPSQSGQQWSQQPPMQQPPVQQSQWGQPAPQSPQQPQWGQTIPPSQSGQQSQWGQQPPMQQPPVQQPQWGQPGQPPQQSQWGQAIPSSQSGQQSQWGQQPQQRPSQGDDDRTVYRR